MHSLSTSFVLGYHGCDSSVGERLLRNSPFKSSENSYDWLGHGIYFWESNPDRALDWAREVAARERAKGRRYQPFVVGAVIDLGFCLDLLSTNGIAAVREAHEGLLEAAKSSGDALPKNTGGRDRIFRHLDCAVMQYLHLARKEQHQQPFDTVRAVFTEGEPLYKEAGFREKTHIQICVANSAMIKGVFRVPADHFSQSRPSAMLVTARKRSKKQP